MERVNPDMLVLARDYLGLSQSALAQKLSFTQATLSRYESGSAIPEEHLAELVAALNRPRSFFFRSERTYPASSMFHRSRRLTAGEMKRLHAQVNDLRIRARILLREAQVESIHSFYRLSISDFGSPENVAKELRRVWQISPGPIKSVVAAIESAGGIVFRCPFNTDKVDGVSQWAIDDASPPVLFVNSECPGDRQRFTLSHEIGHTVMHHMPTHDPESEADRFASEFLMPAAEIRDDLKRLTLERAASLKSYWKVSMAAIVRRAYDLNGITERQYRQLNMLLAKFGYKRVEPFPIRCEEPRLLNAIVEAHRTGHRHSDSQLAEWMGMHLHDLQATFGHGFSGLRLVI